MAKYLDIMKPRYSEQNLPVPCTSLYRGSTAVHHHKIKKNNWFICTPYVTLLSFISNSTPFPQQGLVLPFPLKLVKGSGQSRHYDDISRHAIWQPISIYLQHHSVFGPPQNTLRLPPKFCKVSVLKCSWEEGAFENFTTYNSQRFHLSS